MPDQPCIHTTPASSLFASKRPAVAYRSIHLDLKGVPPTPERLLSLLEVFAAARFNSVLVEWEDMFPWICDRRFRAETAYTEAQVRAFADKAQQLGIEIIPLVQCLGHMETPLRFPEYASLREVPEQTGVLNPLAPGAGELIRKMIDEVLALLPNVRYFHLGGDEAWSFGTHPDTKAYIAAHGKGALYLHHVEPLLDHLLARGIRPILWHDMMCHWDTASLNRIKAKADLCVWGYQRTPELVDANRHYHIDNIRRYREHGLQMWGATAYKGGDGADLEIPVYARRLENLLGWVETSNSFNMKGVFVTGWSRYCTLTTQLSPIDSSLDFLILAATILHEGHAPASGLDACEQFLKQIGEYERYSRCRSVMAELSRRKLAAWDQIRVTRENLACSNLDPARGDKTIVLASLSSIERHIEALHRLAGEVKTAFHGLVPSIWMERYVGDRTAALEGELCDIHRLLQTAVSSS